MPVLSPCRLLALVVFLGTGPLAAAQSRSVVVNGQRLSAEAIASMEGRYGVRVQDGVFWYDAASGAWGLAGGATEGILPAGLPSAPLSPDASRGRTPVWVNGRRLPTQDLRALEALTGPIPPGRYWIDARGLAGPEGGPATVDLARLARQAGGSNGPYRSGITGIGANSSGGSGYVMGRGWSVSY